MLGEERAAAGALAGALRALRAGAREAAAAAEADRRAFERGRAAVVLVKEVARREARAAGDLRCRNAAYRQRAEALEGRLAEREGALAAARRAAEETQGRAVALQGEIDGLRAARARAQPPAPEEAPGAATRPDGRPPLSSPASGASGRPSPRAGPGPSRLSPAAAARSARELQSLEKLFSRQWGGQTPVRTSRGAGPPPEALQATPEGAGAAPGRCRPT